MLITHETPGSTFILLAFNGELVGYVKEAYVATKEGGGYIVQARIADPLPAVPDPSRAVDPLEWVKHEGRVDILGMDGDPPEMITARLESIRAHMGLPSWVSLQKNRSHEEDARDVAAWSLEDMARKVRRGENVVSTFSFDKQHDRFPTPTTFIHVPTGHLSMTIDYTVPSLIKEYEEKKAQWAKDHPDQVVEYLRGKPEGSKKP